MARVDPDANDVLVLFLNDGPGTHTNTGTAASADWTDYGNPISGAQGLLGDCIYIPSSYISSNHDGAGGDNDVLVTPNISLSGWVFLRRYTNYFAEIFNKQYFLNGLSSPFLTFGFQLLNTSDGQLDLYITLNGTLQFVRTPSTNNYLPVGRWCHIGGTWDGTTLRMYINGGLVVSSNFSGTIDYGTLGNRGQWYVGCVPGSSTVQGSPVMVQDIRVANVVRPQSYFANIYHNGFQT